MAWKETMLGICLAEDFRVRFGRGKLLISLTCGVGSM